MSPREFWSILPLFTLSFIPALAAWLYATARVKAQHDWLPATLSKRIWSGLAAHGLAMLAAFVLTSMWFHPILTGIVVALVSGNLYRYFAIFSFDYGQREAAVIGLVCGCIGGLAFALQFYTFANW